METQPYYWTNPLIDRFEITIESILEANGHFYVRILEMVAKPSGGGQAGDRGVVIVDGEEYPFIDTVIHEGRTALLVKKPPKKIGKGGLRLDMVWRRDMMANHTSEHIFVGALKKKYPTLKLGKIWIDGLHGTIDVEEVKLSLQAILDAESEVTRLIHERANVTTEIVQAEDVDESIRAREGVTSKHESIRLVRVGEFDSSACSGLHVINTQEICVFKIVDIKIGETETHIEFISGQKAVEMLCSVYNDILVRKYDYPFEIDQLGAVLDKSKNIQIAYDQSIEKILQLLKNGPQMEIIDDVVFWYEFIPGLDSATVKYLLKELDLQSPSITLFFAPGKKTNLTLWTKGMPKDASQYIARIVEQLGGRGGGSAEAYTGGFTDITNPEELFTSIVKSIRDQLQ
ncbi:hypothetical protein EU527_07940 [Candidatus Thorarchaeota archaeon]|nr:MAG: hypothetical protein EU527_07940 [Candidatus Thorarchaeota archaeon]